MLLTQSKASTRPDGVVQAVDSTWRSGAAVVGADQIDTGGLTQTVTAAAAR